MKNIFILFQSFEKKLFKDKINTNSHFATTSILISLALGAIFGGSSFLDAMFDGFIMAGQGSSLVICSLIIMSLMFGVILSESLFSSKTITVGLLRALVVLICIVLGYSLGIIGSVVILGIIVLILGITLLLGILNAMIFGDGRKGDKVRIRDEYGKEVSGTMTSDNTVHTDDGREYHRTTGNDFS